MFCDPLVLPKVPLRYDFFTPIVPLPSSEDDFLKIRSLYTRLFPPLPNAATWSVWWSLSLVGKFPLHQGCIKLMAGESLSLALFLYLHGLFVCVWLLWSFENPTAESCGSLWFSRSSRCRGRLDYCKGPVSLLLLINLLCNGKGACWRARYQLNLWWVSLYLTHTANKASFFLFFFEHKQPFGKLIALVLSWKGRYSPWTSVSSANQDKQIKNLSAFLLCHVL